MPFTSDLRLTSADAEALEKKIDGIKVIRNFISVEEEKILFNLIDSSQWNLEIKRRTQQYGAKYNYRTQKSNVVEKVDQVPPIPDAFDFVLKRLLQQNVYTNENPPDQIIINEYTKGQGILHHTDAIKLWGPVVSTLSIGSPAVMGFKLPKKIDPEGKENIDIILEPRSLVVLSGPARYKWQHGISKNASFSWKGEKYLRPDDYRRISLTFRTIVRDDDDDDDDEDSDEDDS